MSHNLISVENLSKGYLLGDKSRGQTHEAYLALRDFVGREMRSIAPSTLDPLPATAHCD